MPLRVFLVEDLIAERDLLEALFTSIGGVQVVGTAASEPDAEEWLDRHAGHWDVAVIDLVLEHGSGFGVIRRARQHSRRGGIVVFSGYVTQTIREHCLRLGANAAFEKSEIDALRRWLEQAKANAADTD
jgi:two-component system, OmpR family, response regulator